MLGRLLQSCSVFEAGLGEVRVRSLPNAAAEQGLAQGAGRLPGSLEATPGLGKRAAMRLGGPSKVQEQS